MTSERKEIIAVNGLVLAVIMAVIANAVLLGAIYRWYQYRFFVAEVINQREHSIWLMQVREEKNQIVKLEGVPNWNATAYAQMRPESKE